LASATPLAPPEEEVLVPELPPVLVPELVPELAPVLVAELAGVVPDALAELPEPPDEDLLLPHAASATAQITTRTSDARRLFRLN
jgi:hypothetical protein